MSINLKIIADFGFSVAAILNFNLDYAKNMFYSQSANLITPFWRNKLAQKMGTTLLQQLRNCDGNVA